MSAPMREVTHRLNATGVGGQQVTGLLALALDRPADNIAGYAIAVVTISAAGEPQICVISSFGTNRRAAAAVLRHAAGHMLGRCRRCTGKDRKAIRGNG